MKKLAATLSLGLFGLGCGLSGGDYMVYRIANSDAETSGCGPNDGGDSSTLRNGTTIMVYFVETEAGLVPYLDIGTVVIEGEESEEGYYFEGKTVDKEDQGNATTTTTTTYKIDLALNGDTVTLDTTITLTVKCSGECQGFDSTTCKITSDSVGVLLDEDTEVPAKPAQ